MAFFFVCFSPAGPASATPVPRPVLGDPPLCFGPGGVDVMDGQGASRSLSEGMAVALEDHGPRGYGPPGHGPRGYCP